MFFKNKKIALFIFGVLFITSLFVGGSILAQQPLEVSLPDIGEATLSENPILPDYIKYIFNFAIGISGLVAFISLIMGGVRYLISAGNPAALQDANDQMFSAIIGMIVVLGSWIILTTIDPQLVVISLEKKATPDVSERTGIFLCKTNATTTPDNCEGPFITDLSKLSSTFDNATNYVLFKNPENVTYGVILHNEPYLKGECEVVVSSSGKNEFVRINELSRKTSSVSVFNIDKTMEDGSVTVCAEYDCEKINADKEAEAQKTFSFNEAQVISGYEYSYLRGIPNIKAYKYDTGDGIGSPWGAIREGWSTFLPWGEAKIANLGVSAIKVDKCLVILFRQENYTSFCELFDRDDPNLGNGNIIGNDSATSLMIIKGKK